MTETLNDIQRSCVKCFYAEKVDGQMNQYVCRRFPPSVSVIPQQTPMGQVQLAQICALPQVVADMWCHEFKENPAKLALA